MFVRNETLNSSSSPSESRESVVLPGQAANSGAADESDVSAGQGRVHQLAAGSVNGDAFLRDLAGDLLQQFDAAVVAVKAPNWPAAMMLVRDEATSTAIDRDSIRSLLDSAQSTPIACTIPAGEASTRGLRVELSPTPFRAAVLLIYPVSVQGPSSQQQILALQNLNRYAATSRPYLQAYAETEQAAAPEPSSEQAVPPRHVTTLTTAGANLFTPEIEAERVSLRGLHRDLDLTGTAYRIVNESRRLIGCDRVTLLLPKGNRLGVKAISGVAVVDPRSNSVTALQRMTRCAVVMARPLVLPGGDGLPPQIRMPLDEYLDESGVTSCVLVPLYGPDRIGRRGHDDLDDGRQDDFDPFDSHGEMLGVMVLEYFDGHGPLSVDRRMRLVASEAAIALRNSLEHQRVFGLPVLKAIGGLGRRGSRIWWLTGFLVAAACLVASLLIRVDHRVIATGQAQPQVRRQVFAGIDGVVKELLVRDGDRVRAGDALIRLENADLETKLQDLSGQLQTATQRLRSLQSMRLGNRSDVSAEARLAMEERQLISELEGLRSQQSLLRDQQAELTVPSPIDGRVVAWQLTERLSDRPVSRGNALLTVVDESGPWELSLVIPDADAGPVLEAAKRRGTLPIRFAIATEPQSSFDASLRSLSTATRLDETGQYVIDATADIDVSPDAPATTRWQGGETTIGADVTARIACDRRSLAASWFSDVVDFVHRNVLFYFR